MSKIKTRTSPPVHRERDCSDGGRYQKCHLAAVCRESVGACDGPSSHPFPVNELNFWGSSCANTGSCKIPYSVGGIVWVSIILFSFCSLFMIWVKMDIIWRVFSPQARAKVIKAYIMSKAARDTTALTSKHLLSTQTLACDFVHWCGKQPHVTTFSLLPIIWEVFC